MSYERLYITNFLLIQNSAKYDKYSQFLLYHGCCTWRFSDSMPVPLGWFKNTLTHSIVIPSRCKHDCGAGGGDDDDDDAKEQANWSKTSENNNNKSVIACHFVTDLKIWINIKSFHIFELIISALIPIQ